MNFLAHLHLAAHTGSSLTGNLLGTSSGPAADGSGCPLRRGDLAAPQDRRPFTDAHRPIQGAVASFALWRRFGGIVGGHALRSLAQPALAEVQRSPCPPFWRRAMVNFSWIITACHRACRWPLADGRAGLAGLPTSTGKGWGGPQRHRSSPARPCRSGEALHALDQGSLDRGRARLPALLPGADALLRGAADRRPPHCHHPHRQKAPSGELSSGNVKTQGSGNARPWGWPAGSETPWRDEFLRRLPHQSCCSVRGNLAPGPRPSEIQFVHAHPEGVGQMGQLEKK